MSIEQMLQQIESDLEKYEDAHDPEERMDLKQTITANIKQAYAQSQKLNDKAQKEVIAKLEEFAEILSY
jgi:hypothetical protein